MPARQNQFWFVFIRRRQFFPTIWEGKKKTLGSVKFLICQQEIENKQDNAVFPLQCELAFHRVIKYTKNVLIREH